MKNMKIQWIITWRLPELCSYPQEMMFWLYLFISLLHHNLSPSLSFFFTPHSSSIPIPPPLQPPTSKLSGCCLLLRSEAEWGDLASFPYPRLLFLSFSFFFLISKSTHVYAPNLCTLWFSTSRRELNPGLMCTGSPPLALREKGRWWGGWLERIEKGRAWGVRRKWFSDFLHRLCGPGRLFICVFLSPLVRTRGEEIVLSTAWGLCWAYIFKPPLFRA